MTREDVDKLLELVQDIDSEIQAINSGIYSSDEDYDDLILSAQMSLEKVATTFANTVKYLDEQILLRDLEIEDHDDLDSAT